MKVRKGNDIKLKILLKLSDSNDYANIQSLTAIFVNTTLKDKLEAEYKNKNRFIGRFPIEPFVEEFEPTQYNINSTGQPKYKRFVINEYKGFGVNPDWNKVLPITEVPVTEYLSQVYRTSDSKIVTAILPAEALLYSGVYELIVIAQINAPGFKIGDTRTVTINYKNVFELVDSSEDATDNPVQIEINNYSSDESLLDIYIVSGYYENGDIKLSRNDGGTITVNVKPISEWYEGD